MLVQANGKIFAVGNTSVYTGGVTTYSFAMAGYTADGKLDPTFGVNGKVKTTPGAADSFYNFAAAWDQGKILAIGQSNSGGVYYTALARYNLNGTLDTSFGTEGMVKTPTNLREPRAVAVDPTGNIFVAGYRTVSPYPFAVAKYLPSGALDPSFGIGGIAAGPADSQSDRATAIALQTQNGTTQIVVGGYTNYGTKCFVAARFDAATGSLDTSFGDGGLAKTPILNSATPYWMAIQPADGKIILAGQAADASRFYTALARYTADGILDTSFGSPAALAAAAVTGYATLTTAQPYEPAASPTQAPVVPQGISESSPTNSALVFNGVAQTAGTTEPRTGRDMKGVQLHKRDYLAVDAALQDLEADLLADELAAVLVP